LTNEGGAIDFDVVTELGFADRAGSLALESKSLRTRRSFSTGR
jgi:hypothetical protein